jgi:hypothetical protein
MGCYNTIVVKAPVDQVWKTIRNFHDLSWAEGVVEDTQVVGDEGPDQVGARRILNGVFQETLMALDDTDKSFQYQITEGPGPLEKGKVTGYIGSVRVFPVTSNDTTFVEWTSRWETSEGGVTDFCNPIYQALLGALSAHFDG